MNHLRIWTFAAILAATLAPAASTAQTGENHRYFSIGGLHVVPPDSDQSQTFFGYDASTELEMDPGHGVLLAVGYGAEVGLRGEIEFGWRKIDFDKYKNVRVKGAGPLNGPLDGEFPYGDDVTTLSLMGNGIFTVEAGSLRPYFGIGLGLARHKWSQDGAAYDLGGVATIRILNASDHDTVFAYQALAGVGFALSENTEARLGYRYFATDDAAFFGGGFKTSYKTHGFEAGILVRF